MGLVVVDRHGDHLSRGHEVEHAFVKVMGLLSVEHREVEVLFEGDGIKIVNPAIGPFRRSYHHLQIDHRDERMLRLGQIRQAVKFADGFETDQLFCHGTTR